MVVDYAAEAAGHGAVYLEGIFTPAEPVSRGASWDEVFAGYCDGAQQASEIHGVQVRLTPDISRGYPLEAAELTARYAVRYADRGVVGLGLGGPELEYPPELFTAPFRLAAEGGLAAVPHAGEVAGSSSVRSCLELLGARRIRHGIRAIDDPGLVRELAEPRAPCWTSAPSRTCAPARSPPWREHPLPELTAAGVRCSVSTDDPAMFGTDLSTEYEAAAQLGVPASECYQAGLAGALCDAGTRAALRQRGEQAGWRAA